MHVGTYLLLTVPIVGGSLLAYDSIRRSASEPTDGEAVPYTAPAPRAEPRSETGPMLQGDPTAQIERLVREGVERALRERSGGGVARVVAPDGTPVEGALPQVPSIELPELVGGDEGPVASYDEKTMKTLRAYMDEIDRRQREERMQQMVGGQIDRLGVSITDAQRKAVIETTLKHQNLVRDAMRNLPAGQENRDARTKVVQDMREQYSRQIYALVPAAEADKIVNSLGQGWRGAMGGGGRRQRAGPGRRRWRRRPRTSGRRRPLIAGVVGRCGRRGRAPGLHSTAA